MIKETNKNKNIISNILIIFLLIQPLLDVSYSLATNFLNISFFINSIIRLIFLGIAFIYLIFFSYEKKYQKIVFIILIYMLAFIINIFILKGKGAFFYETKNMLTTFFFPVCLMFLIDFFKKYKIEIKNKYWFILLVIYLVFIIVPNIIGLGFESYVNDKSGLIGWFYSANALGNILVILTPLSILFFDAKKKILYGVLFYLVLIYTFLSMGTKAPIFGLLIIFGSMFIWLLVKLIKEKKIKLISFLSTITIIFLTSLILVMPKTNFYKNIKLHMNYFKIYNVSDMLNNQNFVEQVIFSKRLVFLNNTKTNYQKAKLSEKFLGLGYIENYNTPEESRKTIEIDYMDVFYRHGPIGFILFFLPFILELFTIIKNSFKLSFENYMSLVSISLALLLAIFSGHVFVTPAISIILIYMLANQKERTDKNAITKS